MQIHGYELALLATAFILELAIVVRIVRAGLASEYPSMLRYLVANLVAMAATPFFLRYASTLTYDFFYWFCEITLDCMALGVMLEMFRDIFKPYEALRHFGTIMFRWIVGVLVLVAVVATASAAQFHAVNLLNCGSEAFDRGLMILQCGIVLFLLLSNRFLGINFRQRVFGVATGFGITAAVSLLVFCALHYVPHVAVAPLFAAMNVAARIGDVIWLVYFFLPQPDRLISQAMPESRRWEYALASMEAPAPEGMFLSSIDRTVERLLTKNNVATHQPAKEDKHWFGD